MPKWLRKFLQLDASLGTASTAFAMAKLENGALLCDHTED